ncbi:MAG: hypothetical protein KAR40_03930, partial [Candidatus Sabulitectum sp.]|nr:hypothetical protein [Candidatus Sabulitectum sp.]
YWFDYIAVLLHNVYCQLRFQADNTVCNSTWSMHRRGDQSRGMTLNRKLACAVDKAEPLDRCAESC